MTQLPQVYQVEVSAHAIERFRERIYNASEDTIRAHILTPQVRVWLAAGAVAIHGSNGLRIYANKGTVTTVAPGSWPHSLRLGERA